MKYYVDIAMLEDEWNEEAGDIRNFCDTLQEVVGPEIEIEAITDSCNGAENEDADIVTDSQWLLAIEIDIDRNPENWK